MTTSTTEAGTNGGITTSDVQDYYGKVLQTSDDLKTNACTTAGRPPKYIQNLLSNIHPTVLSKYYGCGLCIPSHSLNGYNVLDLGCGAGRDVYLASQLVGPTGKVVGIDMTIEQLNIANEYIQYHEKEFGYKSNVQFLEGYLEKLNTMIDNDILKKESFDLIISNCVINLCIDKYAVLKSCYDLLKNGGEIYFSDVYCNRRIPDTLRNDVTLYGECLSGALYYNDFISLVKSIGFSDPRLVDDKPIIIENQQVANTIIASGNQNLKFYSATYRLQKNLNLETSNEDYGQAVIYKGTIQSYNDNSMDSKLTTSYTFDKYYTFETGKVTSVCGNTYQMLLGNPQLANHFTFIGTTTKHYGVYNNNRGNNNNNGNTIPYDHQDVSASMTTNGATTESTSGGGCCPSPSPAIATVTTANTSNGGGCAPSTAGSTKKSCC